MKRIIDVRLGLRAINRVYRGETLIWERQPHYKLLANGIGDVVITPKASFELADVTSASMIGGLYEEGMAYPEAMYCPPVAAYSTEDLDTVVAPQKVYPHNVGCKDEIIINDCATGESIIPVLARLIDEICINARVSPTTKVALANGVIEIDINTSGAARNDTTAPLFSVSKIILSEAGHGRNVPVGRVYSHDRLNISIRAAAESSRYHEISSHGKIALTEMGAMDNVQIAKTNLYGTIGTGGTLSSFDGVVRDTAIHGDVGLKSRASGDNIAPTDSSMTALIDAIGRLYASNELITDSASNCNIRIETISAADLIDGGDVQAQGTINTDTIAQMITWRYPTLSGDTLLIIQAFETDDDNLPTLHIT